MLKHETDRRTLETLRNFFWYKNLAKSIFETNCDHSKFQRRARKPIIQLDTKQAIVLVLILHPNKMN